MTLIEPAGEAPMPSAPVVRLQGVTHLYGKTAALDRVDLAIPAGCMAGLIGPDGVGKSTLLGLAVGVTRLQSGTLAVLGEDMAEASVRRRLSGRIAYMPQGLGRNLYPTLSVAENLHFFGRLFGQDEAERNRRIAELLAATGLTAFADRPAGKLSGGMKQKLGICAALIHDPDLLVLDEPTTGIDPLSRRQFWDLIDGIRARRPGMSVIVATAYMEEADRFDWLAAMYDGHVIASGSPADIKTQTGEASLDAAFIALLPAEERARHVALPALTPLPADSPIAIEAIDLTCRFGDFTAVDHVSFRIRQGEIFGFLGSNGSGKSTTMKMLTGLLAASEGEAKLFGHPLDAGDMATRRRVGYMSQSFSLYSELTVRQNLDLHAQLFQLPPAKREPRVAAMLERFELVGVADARPDSLPLGQRQRLQLAVAVLHEPEILILDEPTSGVDPIARDSFWASLIDLSRREGVTIFLSTHFMNEAARCDRISLMHHGKVLAVGTPAELIAARGMPTLEEAFIAVLVEAGMGSEGGAVALPAQEPAKAASDAARETGDTARAGTGRLPSLRRLGAYAWREALEIIRDPLRVTFAFLGPAGLLLAFGFGISFDVEHLPYAVYDLDQSQQSRELLENFEGSRYFSERPVITRSADLDERLQNGDLKLAIEIPPGFGKDLLRHRTPEVGVWLDGAMPFLAETARGYVMGLGQHYLADQSVRHTGRAGPRGGVGIEMRFRYNQDFVSANAMVPNVIGLTLVLIPAIMTALGIVKEKETGSIANFQSTPVSKVEFLIGKQLPYVALSFLSFLTLIALSWIVFDVPIKGSYLTLGLGSLAYIFATTGFGLFVSSFVSSQVAAVFVTAILSIVPTVNFSGLLVPVSSLSGVARVMGLAFPAAWYQPISIGVFAKGLGFVDLWSYIVVLMLFGVGFIAAATLALRKQGA